MWRTFPALLLLATLAPAVDQKGAVWFFLLEDCAASRYYRPEIQRICDEFSVQGIRCTVIYETQSLSDAAAQQLTPGDVRVDRGHRLAHQSGATVTPEAVVFDAKGRIVYRGRINDYFSGWGQRRGTVTEHSLRHALTALLRGQPIAQPWPAAVGCYIETLGEKK